MGRVMPYMAVAARQCNSTKLAKPRDGSQDWSTFGRPNRRPDTPLIQSKVPVTRPSNMKARAVRVSVRATISASVADFSNSTKV